MKKNVKINVHLLLKVILLNEWVQNVNKNKKSILEKLISYAIFSKYALIFQIWAKMIRGGVALQIKKSK